MSIASGADPEGVAGGGARGSLCEALGRQCAEPTLRDGGHNLP